MLIDKESHQREAFTEWPIRLALNVCWIYVICFSKSQDKTKLNKFIFLFQQPYFVIQKSAHFCVLAL